MAVFLSPVGGVAAQFFDNNGVPLTGGKIYTYLAGTTTPVTTYVNSNGTTAHPNPIILDAAGRVPSGEIWLSDGVSYKFVTKTATDVLIGTYDNITGINSNFVSYTNQQEIQTATAGQTVFTLTTMQYQAGTGSLSVFVDGVNQYGSGAQYAYVETDSTTVTFTSGLHVGASVKFTTTQQQSAGVINASQVSYTPPFTGAPATNVQVILDQLPLHIKDFGAVGDGITDDTLAIRAAIAATPAYGTLVFDTCAVNYLVDATSYAEHVFLLDQPITIIGEAQSLVKLKNNSNLNHLGYGAIIRGDSANITIDGVQVDGNFANNPPVSPSTVGSHAIYLSLPASSGKTEANFVVKNCQVSDSGFSSILVSGASPTDQAVGCSIVNNLINGGREDGIHMSYVLGGIIDANRVIQNRFHSIHVYTDCYHISVTNNYIENSATPYSGETLRGICIGHDAPYTGTVQDVSVVGNHVYFDVADGLERFPIQVIADAQNVSVTANTVIGGYTGIYCGVCSYGKVVIANNTVDQSWQENIGLFGSSYTIVEGNTLSNANQGAYTDRSGAAISILRDPSGPTDSQYNRITGNHVRGTTQSYFVSFGTSSYASSNNMVEGNTFTGTPTQGIIDGALNASNVVKDNVGAPTETGGTYPLHTSPITIAHGLISTPGIVLVTPIYGSATNIYASADATNITITFSGSTTMAFYYSASLWP